MAKLFHFQVAAGCYINGKTGQKYLAGERFKTLENLAKKLNRPGTVRFITLGSEDVPDGTVPQDDVAPASSLPVEEAPPDLESLTEGKLREYCVEKDIDLTGVRGKANIIARIHEHFEALGAPVEI